MELANKHHLGRKLRRSWLVSYLLCRSLRVFERDGLEGSCRKFGL